MNLKNSLSKIAPLNSFNKKINLTTSKSHSNRALILGAIRGDGFRIDHLSDSTDVTHLLEAFEQIGLKMQRTETSVTFLNSFPKCEQETTQDIIELHTGDGGTTNRFLLALLSRGKKEYHLFPSEKLAQRPIEDLINPLKKLDVKVSVNEKANQDSPWVRIEGPASMYNTTKLEIDCAKSTQFASAMLLAFSNLPLKFSFLNVGASEDYLKMTEAVIKKVLPENKYIIPIDFSSLGYPVALAALNKGGSLLVSNAHTKDETQADSRFLELISQHGASVEWTKEGLLVAHQKELTPFEFEIKNAPDLFPTLVFLAAHINGTSKLYNLEVLKYKESDRLDEMFKVMDAFGVQYQYNEAQDELLITGRLEKYSFAIFHPPRDHRIVMSTALFMAQNNGGELSEVDCIDKSYPDFMSLLE